MNQQKLIASLEDRARKAGIAMSEVCRRANVHPTTFSRWKVSERNPKPIGATYKSISAIDAALAEAEATEAAA